METEDMTPALAAYIVREFERVFPARPIGRSKLQKLMYILSKDGNIVLSFDLFMNGPYSDSVENALCLALGSGMMTAVKENGRSSLSARGGIPGEVPFELMDKVNRCIQAYGFYDEGDLAIMTAGLFLEGCFCLGPDELIKAVLEINPRFELRRVCSVIDRSDLLFRSW